MIDGNVFDAISAFAILLMLITEIAKRHRYSTFDVVVMAVGLAFIASAICSDSKILLQAFIIVYLLRDIDFHLVAKWTTYLLVVLLLTTGLLFFAGVIPDTVISGGRSRSSLGFVWPSRAGNFILAVGLSYICAKRDKCSPWFLFGLLLVSFFAFLYTDARNPMLFTAILVVLWLFAQLIRPKGHSRSIALLFAIVPIVLAVVVIYTHANFNPQIGWMSELNRLLTNRLRYSYTAFHSTDLLPFGCPLFNDGVANKGVTGYLDSGYLRLLLTYGYTPFFVLISGLSLLVYQLAWRGEAYYLICLICVLLRSMVDGGFVFLQYTLPLLLFFNGEVGIRGIVKNRCQRHQTLFVAQTRIRQIARF